MKSDKTRMTDLHELILQYLVIQSNRWIESVGTIEKVLFNDLLNLGYIRMNGAAQFKITHDGLNYLENAKDTSSECI